MNRFLSGKNQANPNKTTPSKIRREKMPKKSAQKASIVQLVERLLAKQKVTSSNLVTRSTKKPLTFPQNLVLYKCC